MTRQDEVRRYWLDEVGLAGWYKSSDDLDAQIRDRFEGDWTLAIAGKLHPWLTGPEGALAFLILTDQFPRNMFRGQGRAFASDGLALSAAKKSIARGWDLRIPEPQRQFFYMPLMHSECLVDQDRCVRLILTRMPEGRAQMIDHARAHRAVIREFGRFPYRNDALGRVSRADEQAYLAAGGYGFTFNSLDAAA